MHPPVERLTFRVDSRRRWRSKRITGAKRSG